MALEIAKNDFCIVRPNDHVKMIEHEDIGINFERLVPLAVSQTVRQNFPAVMTVKQIIPIPQSWG